MTAFVFPPQPQTTLAIRGRAERFPVHRIYCVGRNFAEHAKEMGAEAPKGKPVFFMKPADAALQSADIPYPGATADLHHEVELVVAIGPDLPDTLTADNAGRAIFAYAVGLALTRRDLAQGDQESAARRMHTLASNAGFLCALDLMTAARELEEAIDKESPELDARLVDIGQQIDALVAASAPWR